MGSSPLTIGQASDAVDVSIQKYWLKNAQEKEEYFRKFYNVTTGVTDLYLKESGISGLGESAELAENATIVAEVPVQTFDKTYTQVMFSKMLGFTWKMWKFGIKKRDVTRIVSALKDAAYTNRENRLARYLDAGWLTSHTYADDSGSHTVTGTGGDSAALYTASHTREDGGTAWSNLVSDGTTANMNLDYPGLKALYRIAALVKNPKGQPFPVNPNRIMVKKGTTAAFRAKEILGALKNNKIPGEFSNDGAAIESFELVENPFLLGTGDATSTTNLSAATNWHAVDSTMIGDEYGLQYFESQPAVLDDQNIVYKTKEIQYSVLSCYAYGHNDPRINFGGTGANA